MSRRIVRSISFITLLVAGLFWLPGQAPAQVTTAEIQGVVRDSQGAVVPGAVVTAVHGPSESTYSGVTQSDGRFFFRACASAARTRSASSSAAARRKP